MHRKGGKGQNRNTTGCLQQPSATIRGGVGSCEGRGKPSNALADRRIGPIGRTEADGSCRSSSQHSRNNKKNDPQFEGLVFKRKKVGSKHERVKLTWAMARKSGRLRFAAGNRPRRTPSRTLGQRVTAAVPEMGMEAYKRKRGCAKGGVKGPFADLQSRGYSSGSGFAEGQSKGGAHQC